MGNPTKLIMSFMLASMLVFAIACGSSDDDTSSVANSAGVTADAANLPVELPTIVAPQEATYLKALEPNAKNGGILNYAWVASPPHFDMHQSGTTNNCTPQCPLFDLMVVNDPTDNQRAIVNGGVAQSWDTSADGLTWTFNLRKNVDFHDGSHMTSADVEATFNRIIFPSDTVNSRRKDLFNAVTDVSAPDEYTVNFTTANPVSGGYFLQALASGFNVILSKANLELNNDDLKAIPDYPGTGAFKYVSHVDAEKWIAVKNESYWNPNLPYLEGINTFHVSGSTGAAQRVAGLMTGQFDYARGIDPQTYNKWQANPEEGISTVRFPQTTIIAMWFNLAKQDSVLQDANVRKGISYLFDRDAFVKGTESVRPFYPAFGFVPYFSQYAESTETARNRPGYAATGTAERQAEVDKANELFKAAGVKEGTQLTLLHANSDWQKMMGDLSASMVRSSPYFEVTQEEVEYAMWIEKTEEGAFDLSMGPLVYAFADPSAFARPWYHSEGKTNFSKNVDTKIDDLIGKIDVEMDVTKRKAITRELDLYLEETMPLAPLLWEEFVDAYRSDIKGYDFPGIQGLYNAEIKSTWWMDR
jgi:ABC-type transport system substrate-binding protein